MSGWFLVAAGLAVSGASLLAMIVVNLILWMKKRKIRREIAEEYGK